MGASSVVVLCVLVLSVCCLISIADASAWFLVQDSALICPLWIHKFARTFMAYNKHVPWSTSMSMPDCSTSSDLPTVLGRKAHLYR